GGTSGDFCSDGRRSRFSAGGVSDRGSAGNRATTAVPDDQGTCEVGEHDQRTPVGGGASGDSQVVGALVPAVGRRPGTTAAFSRSLCRGRIVAVGSATAGTGSPRE